MIDWNRAVRQAVSGAARELAKCMQSSDCEPGCEFHAGHQDRHPCGRRTS